MFEQPLPTAKIAAAAGDAEVGAWRRAWTTCGRPALTSRGPGGAVCKLTDQQLDQLADELDRSPAAQDWADWADDQRWALARVAALIRRLRGVDYTLRGVPDLLHRIGCRRPERTAGGVTS